MATPLAAAAYRAAVEGLDADVLSQHYTAGLAWFHDTFTPALKRRIEALSGGAWDLRDFVAIAAGSDVDLMTHLVEAAAPREGVAIWPGDWWGFRVGSTHPDRIAWTREPGSALACLCLPSVRNGHLTEGMAAFLEAAPAALLNINLYPTLAPGERRATAARLAPVLPKAVLSVSFSRGFGLTASQLGVGLVHRDHPFCERFQTPWAWHTYFYNAIAARAFLALDADAMDADHAARRAWVAGWLAQRGLPDVASGSYYVRSFRVTDPDNLPERLRPLVRGEVARLCLKPTPV